jgi:hypothetical protein
MDIRTSNGEYGLQLRTFKRKKRDAFRAFQFNDNTTAAATFSSFWLPRVCPARTITTRANDQKMGRKRDLPWVVPPTR